ncbi:MAG: tripartite tricarboxylate transporter permease, partial [candidate division NC10 bacterium]|nr:tripartite tricarboxylate transporter permease [candidate division NC10 bacterium]
MAALLQNLNQFLTAIAGFLTPLALFHVFWSTLLGIIIGALPGLTATMGVALVTTLTYKLPPDLAILILICVYNGAIYGGSRSAILLNIPGTPANAATTLDGFPLARAGLAGKAMGIATSGSVLGSLIGMFFLATVAPVLGNYALKLQSFAFFWRAIFGIAVMRNPTAEVVQEARDSIIPRLGEVFRYWRTIIRSGLIGTIIGIIPGVGEDIAAW